MADYARNRWPDNSGISGRFASEYPVLYLSRFIIGTKGDYYRLIQEVPESGAWEPWIVYMLTAITETATQTREKIEAIRALIGEVGDEIKAKCPRVYSLDLLNVLFAQPYTKISSVQDAYGVSRQTASSYLQELAKCGFLRQVRAGRDVYYLNSQYFELLIK